jgi:hypothetical protein
VRDSDRILGVLQSKSKRAEEKREPVKQHLLLTRYDPARVERGEMLKLEDVLEILAIPLLGVIPESESVLKASNTGSPVIMDARARRARPMPTPSRASSARRSRTASSRCRRSPACSGACSAAGGRHELAQLLPLPPRRAGERRRQRGEGPPAGHHQPRARDPHGADFLPKLQQELVQVVARYIAIDPARCR